MDLENDDSDYMQIVSDLAEDIDEAYQKYDDVDMNVMCVRGLFMLLQIEHLTSYDWIKLTYEILRMINQHYEVDINEFQPDDHILTQFLVRMSNSDFLNYLISTQKMLTRYIIIGVDNMDVLEESVRFIDLLWRINRLKPQEHQIATKEFYNDAINNHVDLSP